MQILVNGEERETAATTLAALLRELELDEAVVATARNGAFVPVSSRQDEELVPNDRIEILSPMQGG